MARVDPPPVRVPGGVNPAPAPTASSTPGLEGGGTPIPAPGRTSTDPDPQTPPSPIRSTNDAPVRERVQPPATRHNTTRRARERLAEEALPSVEAAVRLRDNAKDEAIQLRAAQILMDKAIPDAPDVHLHLVTDPALLAADLTRILDAANNETREDPDVIDVEVIEEQEIDQ